MRRFSPILPVLVFSVLFWANAVADEASNAQELRELRQTVEQQSKKIQLLAEQIGRLTRALDAQKAPETSSATTSIEPAKPAAEPPAEAAPAAPRAEAAPKAEPAAATGATHTVAKGETLTSIAKHYNISITELKNANKNANERKLQIGQILVVPTAKTPEPTDKRENP